MGDLYSIADNSSHHSSSLGWEFHNLGVFNANFSQFVDSTPFLSPLDSDLSTGYLQDALFEFNSKRRRLLLFSEDENKESNDSVKSSWYSNYAENSSEDYGCQSHMTSLECISGEPISRNSEDSNFFSGTKTPEEAISAFETFDSSSTPPKESSVNNLSTSDKDTLYNSIHAMNPSGVGEKRKKRVITGVVYPFALVKPGGIEGDMTLNDINERILMPPTRPVRHPVGDFACQPLVSPDGPGLSGKAVVAFTRIQTQGRGTITIIRTKG